VWLLPTPAPPVKNTLFFFKCLSTKSTSVTDYLVFFSIISELKIKNITIEQITFLVKRQIPIKTKFQNFFNHFGYLELEQAIELFSVFGGVEASLELDFFDDVESIIRFNFVDKYRILNELISPSYLIDEPYRFLLVAIARGDGRLSNIFRKAKVGESLGLRLLDELKILNIIEFDESREPCLKKHPNQKLEKSLRSYKIEAKVRFTQPFYRFWFGFVEPYHKELVRGDSKRFFENFEQHFFRLHSFVFEQLSQELLNVYFKNNLILNGNYWDVYSEFDIWAETKEGLQILGECKYTNRRVCKSELSKLKQKAVTSGLDVNTFALFSKSGFSNELKNSKEKNLLLFELEDFRGLL
jgi:hypothetical protein